MDQSQNKKWETEYQEAGSCFRIYTNFLIEIVKGFAAGNGLLFVALTYLTRDVGLQPQLSTMLVVVLGILISLAAIIIQDRTHRYWLTFLDRASGIEKKYGYQLYTSVRQYATCGRLRSSRIVLFVYGIWLIFWVIVLLKMAFQN